jgi:ketosteroid isomerase-like protein
MTTAAPTATEAVARELVDLCRAGHNLDALGKLYATNIVSIEAGDFQGMAARMTGLDAIRRKNEWWFETYQVHSSEAEGPFINKDQFCVKFTFDVTEKKTGKRTRDSEIAVYTVKNAKIVEERFYAAPWQG